MGLHLWFERPPSPPVAQGQLGEHKRSDADGIDADGLHPQERIQSSMGTRKWYFIDQKLIAGHYFHYYNYVISVAGITVSYM